MSDSLYTPDELLIVALRNKRDYVEALRLLTDEGADINAQNIRGETPLFMMSLLPGGQPAVEWLLAHGADPDIAARTGDTPLMAAVKQNNPPIVKALLQGGANPNIANNRGVVPLLEAVLIPADKDHGIVRLFLEAAGLVPRDDEPTKVPVKPAAAVDTGPALARLMGQLDQVRPIPVVPSSSGAPYQAPDYSYAALHSVHESDMDLSGISAQLGLSGLNQMVMNATGGGKKPHPSLIGQPVHTDPVPGLVLNLDPRTDTQTTPLLAAVTRGQERIVRLLMNAGADAEAADHLGQGILYAAVLADNPRILRTVLQAAPWLNPNAPATSGTTPIAHAAVRGSQPQMVLDLLDIGGDPNARSRNRMAGVGSLLQGVTFQIEQGLPSITARREAMKEAQKEVNQQHKEQVKLYRAAVEANAAGNDLAAWTQIQATMQATAQQGTPQPGGPTAGASPGGPDWNALQGNPYWNGSLPLTEPEPEEIDMSELFDALKEKREEANHERMNLLQAILDKGGDPSLRTESGQLAAPLGAVYVGAADAMALFAKSMKTGLDRPYDTSCMTALDMFSGADLDHKDPASLEAMNNLIDLGVPVQRPHWDETIDGPIPPLEGRDAPAPRNSLPIQFYQSGWWDGLMCLLERGGNVNEPNPLGITLAHQMVSEGSALPDAAQKALALMERQIVQKGGNPATDIEYQEARKEVINEHNSQLNKRCAKLGEFHIDWSVATNDGVTPLHVAVKNGDAHWVDFLLEQPNVDPTAAAENGQTPVSIALAHGDIRLFNQLVRAAVARGQDDPTGAALLTAIQNAPEDFRAREPLRRTITLLGAVARLDRKAPHSEIMAPVIDALNAHQAQVQAITDARQEARTAAKERNGVIKDAQKQAQQQAKANGLSPEATREAIRDAGEAAQAAQTADLEARLRAGEKIPGVSLTEIDNERTHASSATVTTRMDAVDPSVTYRDPALDMPAPPGLVLAPIDLLGHTKEPAEGSFTALAQQARTSEGHNAVILAAALGQNDILRVLLQEGFDVNAADKDGNTALMQAVFNEDGEVIRLLRAGGARKDAANAAGQTAEDVANYVKSVYVHNALTGGDLSGPLQDIVPPEPTDTFQHDAWRAQVILDRDNGLLTADENRLAAQIPWSQQIQAVNESLEKEAAMRQLAGQQVPAAGNEAAGAEDESQDLMHDDDGDMVVDVSGFGGAPAQANDTSTGEASPSAAAGPLPIRKKDLLGLDEEDDSLGPMAKATRGKRSAKSSPRSP